MGKLSNSILSFYSRDVIVAVNEKFENMSALFRYELCSHTTPIFETSSFPREAKKAEFANALWNKVEGSGQTSPEGKCKYVVDGGDLLQCIVWIIGQTYGAVINSYK